MIKVFRSVGTKIAAGVFALLMLIFVLTSVDWGQLGAGGAIGKINGQRVDARVYQTAVQQAVENRQRQSPAGLSLDDYAEIQDEVWEQFVQRTVLEEEYRRRRITVSDDEVVEALRYSPLPEFRNAPDFQTDSQFDIGKYQRWLSTSAAQPVIAQLDAYYRDQIKQEKLLQSVTADLFLSDAALWERYRDQYETVKVGLAGIVPRNVIPDSSITVTPQEVEAYYQAHRDEFKRPRTAYLSYLSLSRVPTAADTAIARARTDSLRQEIAGGAPFAEVAQRESADTSSGARGGDLGKWTRGTMDPAFDSAAAALPLKTLSSPVLSRFGFHLIEITSRKADTIAGRHILIPVEVAGAHRDSLDRKADSLEELAVERPNPAALDSAAAALRLPIGKTAPIPAGGRALIGAVPVPDAGTWAFDAKVGSTSPLIDASWAFYVFRLDSLQKEGIPTLAEIRPAVEAAARDAKKRPAARKLGERYLERVTGGTSMADAAEAMGIVYREIGPFTRMNPPLASPVIIGTAFGLEPKQRSGLLETAEGFYVIQSLERTSADSTQFAGKLAEIRAQAIQQARQDRIRAYMDALRKTANVVDRRSEARQRQTGTPS